MAVNSATASRILREACLIRFLNKFTTMTMTAANGATKRARLKSTTNRRTIAPDTVTAFEIKFAMSSLRTFSTSFVSLTTREIISPVRDESR